MTARQTQVESQASLVTALQQLELVQPPPAVLSRRWKKCGNRGLLAAFTSIIRVKVASIIQSIVDELYSRLFLGFFFFADP